MKKIKLVYLGVIVLLLNVIWEFSHYRLYIDMSGISPVPHLLLASITDLLLIGLIFTGNSLLNKGLKWVEKPELSDYCFIVIFSVLFASLIERNALNIGRWAYTDAMPLLFGIGLSPLIQLFVTGIVSLFIFRFFITIKIK